MKIIANSVVNEAFADTPEALRAQNPERARRGGWYDSQVCPSAPGGMAYLRRQDERLLREFWGRINPEYFLYWPYDQGGCGCDRCHPWAENGFLQLYMRRREIARHFFPQAKFILSSWMFDSADYEFLRSALNENEVTCDMLLRENGGPAGMLSQVPEIGFPEISMNMLPWGAYGANPQPVRFQREWEERRGRIVGAVAYSEGIFEDINKILFAEFLSGDTPWRDALRLYAAYEFGEECTEPALELIARLEANHNLVPRPFLDYQERRKKPASVSSRVAASVAETLRLAEKIDACLPPWRRNNFRWRLIFLRSCLDQIYVESGGMPTPLADECCRELRRISYAENADNAVRPLLAGEYAGIEDLL